LPLCMFLSLTETRVTMPGKPNQSCLIPYEAEILSLRHRRPPMSYKKIAAWLCQEHHIDVCRETIFKFMRVRSRGRKVFSYGWKVNSKKPTASIPSKQRMTLLPSAKRKPVFEYVPSDRYNLTRLSPEEAARKLNESEEEA
jgi:hypothetical protein